MVDLQTSKDTALDIIQEQLSHFEPVDCPLRHVFLKGVYIRQIFMPHTTVNSKGETVETVVVSKVHDTEHPFVVTEGKVAVYNKADDFLGMIEAPYAAMTIPGTRRLLHIQEDCYWLTLHILPYITGDENNLPEAELNRLLERIEMDLIRKEGELCHS